MSTTVAPFPPAWWLPGPHAQTLWAALARRPPRLRLRPERLELPDGDFLDLVWTPPARGPWVVVLHGLEGSRHSPYAAGMLAAVAARGWQGVLMHFRGCSGEPNRLARSYHSGDTGDIGHVLACLRVRAPERPLAAVGYSLGGSVLLNHLAEQGADSPLTAAAAVSVPFELADSAATLARWPGRLYQWKLLGSVRHKTREKFRRLPAPVPLPPLEGLRDFRSFDHHVTAPLHGFTSADEYYGRASCRQRLSAIQRPTLVLHALDDPFMTPACVPTAKELGPAVTLEISAGGGHVGFVSGCLPWRPVYWLEQRIPAFLAPWLDGSP